MSRYAPDSRDRVRDAVDMVRLVESRVELRRAGHNSYFGCCPFHDERTASFHVRPDEKHYHCFGCSESGDPFSFVMATEGLDFVGALESLAARFNVTLETVDEDPAAAAQRGRRERLYSLLTRTATFYERMLWESREGERVRRYLLDERGLAEDVLRRFRLGWAPDGWDRVLLGSRGAGFSDDEMLAAGLIQRSRKDTSRLYDRFRAQIMFPTADARGRVIGFGGRKLPGDDRDWLGKYINTAEGELYSKRTVLYGISEARGPAAKAGAMVLAEGYTDVIALHQAGVVNAVGIMGTSLTKEQVSELRRLVGTLVLCLDADNAGQDAMARAAALCAETGLELRVVALPAGADPGELINAAGPEALSEQVTRSVPYVVFEVERILGRADLSSAEGKDRAISVLAPALARVPASVQRDELLRRIAGALAIDETRLVTYLERVGSGGGLTGPPPARNAGGSPAAAGGSRGDANGASDPDGDPGPIWDGDTGEAWDGDPAPAWVQGPGAARGAGTGGAGGRPGDSARRERSAPPTASPRRSDPVVRGGTELGVKTEREYLAMCLAGGEAGRGELERIDPDALLTSAVLRRAVRRLTGQLEMSPEATAVSTLDDARLSVAVSEEQVSSAIDDLESRAARAAKAGRTVSPEELQHARLLLELACVERQLQTARVAGEGIASLAAQRQQVRRAIGEAVARISARGEES